jgi:hypothetical protein
MKTTFQRILWVFIALVLIQSACTFSKTQPTQVPKPATTQPSLATPTLSAPLVGIYPPAFASYNEIPARLPQTFSGG